MNDDVFWREKRAYLIEIRKFGNSDEMLKKTHKKPSKIITIIAGLMEGKPTIRISDDKKTIWKQGL